MLKQLAVSLLIVLLVSGLATGYRSRTKKEAHQGPGSSSALGVEPAALSTLKQQKADGQPFTCDNGAKVLAWTEFNDDYCDCEDGTDEPGTSACAGRTQSSDQGFYCRNVGHIAKLISSSFVNDGVCDCCDGSDETLSGACKPQCLDEFRQQTAEKHQHARMHEQGTMVLRSWQRQTQTELAQKHSELAALETTLREAEVQLAAEEVIEQRRREEAALSGSPGLPREDDAGDDELFTGESQEHLYQHLSPIDDEDDFVDQLKHEPDNDQAAEADEEEDDDDDEDNDNEDDAKNSAGVFLEREEVKELRKTVKELKEKVDDLTTLLNLNFGPNSALYMLYDKLHQIRAENYNYQVRLYKDAKQDHTSIGKFKEFVETDDGKFQMKFTGGQSCWQGPARSLTVEFTCGVETKIISVEEVSKCTYMMVMEACVACSAQKAQEIKLEIARLEKEVLAAQEETDLIL